MICAQCTIRKGVHSRRAWCERGPVLGNGDRVSVTSRTQMGSHALAVMEQLYGRGRRAHFHQFLHQVVNGEFRPFRAFVPEGTG